MSETRPFLTAYWRYLLMINYEVDAAVLEPLLPAGTELDRWDGKTLISMVGFLFERTRVLGAAVPFHVNFEEINLRFYVRRVMEGEVRRGVVFVKEIVPRFWITQVANRLYGEHYVALPMGHTIEEKRLGDEALVEYTWRYRGRLNRMGGLALGEPQPIQSGAEAEFISEHYWGYTRLDAHRTGEYEVAHPRWRSWPVVQPYLLSDVKGLYGEAFEPYLRHRPCSAFLAEGSEVKVYPGKPFTA